MLTPMSDDRSLVRAILIAGVAAIAAYPLLGLTGSIPIFAATFYVVALIGSGYSANRVVAWGVTVAALVAAGVLVPGLAGSVLYGAGAGLFFAGVLLPVIRRRWFAETVE
jgi:hypothetical protein